LNAGFALGAVAVCAASPAPARIGTLGQSRIDVSNFTQSFLMQNQLNGFSHPTSDEISFCAYLIWEKEGRPANRAKEHWLQAETQLLATRAHDGWTVRTGPAPAIQNL
jgi:hypothetical protein